MTAGIKANSDGSAAIQVGGTDVITLTSGGAATFVTSPTTVQAGTAAAPSITFSGDTNTGIYSPGADTIAFTEGGVEAARFDSAGNFGLGVTPSAWRSANKALQIGLAGSLYSLTSAGRSIALGSNLYVDSGGNNVYITTGYASSYQQYEGAHTWYTAASGTAGTTATLTQAMTLDASGQLGVGYTSMNTTLAVNGNALIGTGAWPTTDITRTGSRVVLSSSTENGLLIITNQQSGVAANRGGSIYLGARVTTGVDGTTSAVVSGIKENATSGNYASALTFSTANSVGTITERARISSGGEIKFRNTTGGTDTANTYTSITLGDDSTYAGGLFNVKNAGNRGNKGNAVGSPLARFEFNDATALFIDTSGEVRIGSTTDQGAYNLQCNGTGVWGAAAYVNGSDERIKEDIAPITSGLDVVTKLNPVTYRYKKDWSNDQNIQTGFIAQELLVAMEDKNYVNGIVLQGGSEGYYSVAYQNIIPLLTKAIQEQQAMIDELKAKVAALEGA
jgi:hypothetical protein